MRRGSLESLRRYYTTELFTGLDLSDCFDEEYADSAERFREEALKEVDNLQQQPEEGDLDEGRLDYPDEINEIEPRAPTTTVTSTTESTTRSTTEKVTPVPFDAWEEEEEEEEEADDPFDEWQEAEDGANQTPAERDGDDDDDGGDVTSDGQNESMQLRATDESAESEGEDEAAAAVEDDNEGVQGRASSAHSSSALACLISAAVLARR